MAARLKRDSGLIVRLNQYAHGRDASARVLAEQLRYAGVIDMREGDETFVIWHGEWNPTWQHQNIERMRSFGIVAVETERTSH